MPLSISAPLLTFLLAAAPPSPRPADPSTHRWRLHAEVTPVRMLSSTNGADTQRSWLVSLPGYISIGFGRGLGRYVLVGTRLGGELIHSSSDLRVGGEQTRWRQRMVRAGVWVTPYVELRPLPDRRVQPFGLVEGGVGFVGQRNRSEGPLAVQPQRMRSIDPTVGGRVGLHAFVRPRLSIDADLGLRRQWSFQWSASPATGPVPAHAQPVRHQLAATLGLSGWW